jgi:hypothetical protein
MSDGAERRSDSPPPGDGGRAARASGPRPGGPVPLTGEVERSATPKPRSDAIAESGVARRRSRDPAARGAGSADA